MTTVEYLAMAKLYLRRAAGQLGKQESAARLEEMAAELQPLIAECANG